MTNWTVQDIKDVAEVIEGSNHRASKDQNPYNLFTAWKNNKNTVIYQYDLS
jgi:hypothetical protein